MLKDKRFGKDERNTCYLALRYFEEITEFSIDCLEFEHFGEIVEFSSDHLEDSGKVKEFSLGHIGCLMLRYCEKIKEFSLGLLWIEASG